MGSMSVPKISILIPTLNAESVLEKCLKSISEQEYPKESVEIIVADGGSIDKTREVAKKYGVTVIENPLKTGEAGKMVALRAASGKYVALIDSDNILPDKNWLSRMIEPLEKHPEVLGSEPISYTWRKEDGFIARYCALIGMNDPFVMFLGNYDRINLITGKWTEVPHTEEDFGDYIKVKLKEKVLPTIGANGTVFRTDFLKKFGANDYLFDIDILAKELQEKGNINFIKVKIGIIHTFCESDVSKFIRKQIRRAQDFMFFQTSKNIRSYDWNTMDFFGSRPWGLIKFIISCVLVFPLIIQSLIGYSKKPDPAWFFHPLACDITLFVYAWYRIFGKLYNRELDRKGWGQ